jgi:hypothetical protein
MASSERAAKRIKDFQMKGRANAECFVCAIKVSGGDMCGVPYPVPHVRDTCPAAAADRNVAARWAWTRGPQYLWQGVPCQVATTRAWHGIRACCSIALAEWRGSQPCAIPSAPTRTASLL